MSKCPAADSHVSLVLQEYYQPPAHERILQWIISGVCTTARQNISTILHFAMTYVLLHAVGLYVSQTV